MITHTRSLCCRSGIHNATHTMCPNSREPPRLSHHPDTVVCRRSTHDIRGVPNYRTDYRTTACEPADTNPPRGKVDDGVESRGPLRALIARGEREREREKVTTREADHSLTCGREESCPGLRCYYPERSTPSVEVRDELVAWSVYDIMEVMSVWGGRVPVTLVEGGGPRTERMGGR